MALVRKLANGDVITWLGRGEFDKDAILQVIASMNTEDLTPKQKSYYLQIYDAFDNGTASIKANGNLLVKGGGSSLNNTHLDKDGNFVKPEGTGWGYTEDKTGLSHSVGTSPFTSKGTKELRLKDLDLGIVWDKISSALRKLTPKEKESEEVEKEEPKLLNLKDYTINLILRMYKNSYDKDSFKTFYDTNYKTSEDKLNFIKEFVKYILDNPNISKYDLGEFYTNDSFLLALKLINPDSQEFVRDYAKLGLGDISDYLTVSEDDKDDENDSNLENLSIIELIKATPEFLALPEDSLKLLLDYIESYLKNEEAKLLANLWDHDLLMYLGNRWREHVTNELPSLTFMSPTIYNFNPTKHILKNGFPENENMETISYNLAQVALNAGIDKVTDHSTMGGHSYMQGYLERNKAIIQNNINAHIATLLGESADEFYKPVKYKGLDWFAIIPTEASNGNLFLIRPKDQKKNIWEYTISNITSLVPETDPLYLDYKTGKYKDFENEFVLKYNRLRPIYDESMLNPFAIPSLKEGGILKFAEGGTNARERLKAMQGSKPSTKSNSNESSKPSLDRTAYQQSLGEYLRGFLENLSTSDILNLTSLAADLVSLIPGANVGGLIVSFGANTAALYTDPTISGWQATKNVGANTLWTAVSFIPGFAAAKLANSGRKYAKYAPLIASIAVPAAMGGILHLSGTDKAQYDAIIDMFGNGNWSKDNLRLAGEGVYSALSTLLGLGRGIKGTTVLASNKPSNKTNIKDKNGKNVEIASDKVQEIKDAKNYEDAQKAFAAAQGNPEKPAELPGNLGHNHPARSKYLNKTPFVNIQDKAVVKTEPIMTLGSGAFLGFEWKNPRNPYDLRFKRAKSTSKSKSLTEQKPEVKPEVLNKDIQLSHLLELRGIKPNYDNIMKVRKGEIKLPKHTNTSIFNGLPVPDKGVFGMGSENDFMFFKDGGSFAKKVLKALAGLKTRKNMLLFLKENGLLSEYGLQHINNSDLFWSNEAIDKGIYNYEAMANFLKLGNTPTSANINWDAINKVSRGDYNSVDFSKKGMGASLFNLDFNGTPWNDIFFGYDKSLNDYMGGATAGRMGFLNYLKNTYNSAEKPFLDGYYWNSDKLEWTKDPNIKVPDEETLSTEAPTEVKTSVDEVEEYDNTQEEPLKPSTETPILSEIKPDPEVFKNLNKYGLLGNLTPWDVVNDAIDSRSGFPKLENDLDGEVGTRKDPIIKSLGNSLNINTYGLLTNAALSFIANNKAFDKLKWEYPTMDFYRPSWRVYSNKDYYTKDLLVLNLRRAANVGASFADWRASAAVIGQANALNLQTNMQLDLANAASVSDQINRGLALDNDALKFNINAKYLNDSNRTLMENLRGRLEYDKTMALYKVLTDTIDHFRGSWELNQSSIKTALQLRALYKIDQAREMYKINPSAANAEYLRESLKDLDNLYESDILNWDPWKGVKFVPLHKKGAKANKIYKQQSDKLHRNLLLFAKEFYKNIKK